MTLAAQLEATARRLGVWAPDPTSHNHPTGPWFHPLPSGLIQVGSSASAVEVPIDLAALLLACYADGGRLRMPCPDCKGVKVEVWHRHDDPGCAGSGRVPETVECPHCDEAARNPHYTEGCPVCDDSGRIPAPGKPTGYVDPSLVEAVLRARPTPAIVDSIASAWGNVGQAMKHLEGQTVAHEPGDPTTREHLAVEADKRQNEAVPCSACAGSLVVDGESCRECARVCHCCGDRDPSGYCAPCSRDHERDIKCIYEPDGVDFAATRRRQRLGEGLALWLRGAACPAGCVARDGIRVVEGGRLRGECGVCHGLGSALAGVAAQLLEGLDVHDVHAEAVE